MIASLLVMWMAMQGAQTNARPQREFAMASLVAVSGEPTVAHDAIPALSSSVHAAAGLPSVGRRTFDQTTAQVGFDVHTRWLAAMGGRFGQLDGSIDALPDDQREVRLTLQAASAEFPGHLRSTQWIRSALFFDVTRHPQIVFRSLPFPASRLTTGGTIDGTLELRGVAAPIRFVLDLPTCDKAGDECPLRATGAVSRHAFGMSGMKLVVRDQVEFTLSIRLRPTT